VFSARRSSSCFAVSCPLGVDPMGRGRTIGMNDAKALGRMIVRVRLAIALPSWLGGNRERFSELVNERKWEIVFT
jgi:hypothetical protein